jgi:hypothetical protein
VRRRAALALAVAALVALVGCSDDGPQPDPEDAGRGEILTVAGGGNRAVTAEGVDVGDADLTALAAVAVGPGGEVYVVIHDAPSFPTRSTIARIEGDRIRALPGTEQLRDVDDLDVAPDGSLVLVDATLKQVLRLRDGVLEVVARDLGGKPLEEPVGVDVSDDGTIYVADATGGRIGSVAADGTTTIVREGSFSVRRPGDVLMTDAGVVYFEWGGALVWRVNATTGALEGIAGDGRKGSAGDGGPAVDAELVAGRLAAGPDGELYLAQGAANKVRVIGGDGVIRTVAGTGKEGFSGDGRDATKAELNEPISVVHDRRGGLLIVDFGNGRLRRVVLG